MKKERATKRPESNMPKYNKPNFMSKRKEDMRTQSLVKKRSE